MKTRIAQVIKMFGIMAIVAAFAAAAFPAPSFADSSSDYGKLVVTVYNASSPAAGLMPQPVAGAAVQVLNATGATIAKTTTDSNGAVTFPLPEGAYKIQVSAKGFYPGGGEAYLKAGTAEYVRIGLSALNTRAR